MNRARRPPLPHPLAPLFDRAVDSLCAALDPGSTRHYRGIVRNFLGYLGSAHPEVNSLEQLRRELHLLGWMSRLRSQVPPLTTSYYINRLIIARKLRVPVSHIFVQRDVERLAVRKKAEIKTDALSGKRSGSTNYGGSQ